MPTALIAPGVLRGQPGDFREILTAAGFDLLEPAGADNLTVADLLPCMDRADAVLAGSEPWPASLIRAGGRLRVIARVGVGYDAVDEPAATERGVVLTITPGTNEGSVAEQAFALMLGVCREVARHDAEIRAGGWDRRVARPLRGQILGIAGLGRTGRAVASRARAFGMRVLAYDPFPPPPADAPPDVEIVPLDELLARADIVSLHLPLAAETQKLFGPAAFARMKRGSVFVNTSRGGVVDEEALHDALASGHLAGAGLDVLTEEPPPRDHPLLKLPNVVFSPHIAGVDTTSIADMARLGAQCIVDLYQGRWPEACIVNRSLAGRWSWSKS